jgi:hypothetical protein
MASYVGRDRKQSVKKVSRPADQFPSFLWQKNAIRVGPKELRDRVVVSRRIALRGAIRLTHFSTNCFPSKTRAGRAPCWGQAGTFVFPEGLPPYRPSIRELILATFAPSGSCGKCSHVEFGEAFLAALVFGVSTFALARFPSVRSRFRNPIYGSGETRRRRSGGVGSP